LRPGILPVLYALGRPFGPLYAAAMKGRVWAYGRGHLPSRSLPCPVISVGNLTLGGTGKTPHVVALCRWLQDRGLRPAVVSRGYGGKAGRGPKVVGDGRRVLLPPEIGGDEPVMMAEALSGVPVVAGSDRFAGGALACRELGAQVVVLDDGFQHLSLQREIDIVLLDACRPFGNGRVFPGGDLRESPGALARASVILLTKAESVASNDLCLLRHRLHEILPAIPVFASETRPKGIRFSEGGGDGLPQRLSGLDITAFCALARPEDFWLGVERLGARLASREAFPDHHPYAPADLRRVVEAAGRKGVAAVVTTAKDWVKIAPLWEEICARRQNGPPLWILDVEARPEQGLWSFLSARLALGKETLPWQSR